MEDLPLETNAPSDIINWGKGVNTLCCINTIKICWNMKDPIKNHLNPENGFLQLDSGMGISLFDILFKKKPKNPI